MGRPGSSPDSKPQLVGDASMWISLVASGAADSYLRTLNYSALITDVALEELERGRDKGRTTAGEVHALLEAGLVRKVSIDTADEGVYLSLIGGEAAQTLDDGEAATLAWAAGHASVAIIDERKATLVAALRTPEVKLLTTTDLLLAPETLIGLGESAVVSALFSALTGARMRVPPHRLMDVVKLLGPERAALCHSLPAIVRGLPGEQDKGVDAGLIIKMDLQLNS